MTEKTKTEGSKDNPPPKGAKKAVFASPTVYAPGVEQPIDLPKGPKLGEE